MRLSDKNKNKNFGDVELSTSKHDEIVVWIYSKLKDDEYVKRIFKLPNIKQKDIVIEPAIQSNKQTVYMDVGLYVKFFENDYEFILRDDYTNWLDKDYDFIKSKMKTEGPVFGRPVLSKKIIMFEIKTSLNVGEVVRQIRHAEGIGYQYSSNLNFVVVAPPHPNSKFLSEQGIGFIPYIP